jgi:hypothetical protein
MTREDLEAQARELIATELVGYAAGSLDMKRPDLLHNRLVAELRAAYDAGLKDAMKATDHLAGAHSANAAPALLSAARELERLKAEAAEMREQLACVAHTVRELDDGLRAQLRDGDRLRSELAAARERIREAKDEFLQASHYAHHDPKGTAGANCPACHAAKHGLDLLNAALTKPESEEP